MGCGGNTAVSPSPSPPLPTATPAPPDSLQLVPLVENLERPVSLTHAGDERLFVTEQAGVIRVIDAGQVAATPYLDIRERVGLTEHSWDEQGLLGLAFHPQFQNPDHAGYGRFFINYTDKEANTVLARYTVSDPQAGQADPLTATTILSITQPFYGHNGGQLRFGPDGYLYMSVGDGGHFGDPRNHAQDPGDLLGTILRLDVDQTPYAIPPDNPFVDDPAVRDEIWAYGFRNPWRFSFDRQTGDLFIADVGQNTWEELNYQPAASSGGENYGWRVMEGPVCYEAESCDREGLTAPIHYYDHSQGCAIVGGLVYRGQQFPRMEGLYLFSDFCQGTIWSLSQSPIGRWERKTLFKGDIWISSFGEDVQGEIYVVDNIFGIVSRVRP